MEEGDYYSVVIRLLFAWFVLSALFLHYRSRILSTNKKQLLGIFSRLIAMWLALFFFCTYYHLFITNTLLPVFTFLLNHIQSDYLATLTSQVNATGHIKIEIKMLHDIPPLSPGVVFSQYYHFLPTLQTIVLLTAILTAWPVKNLRDRLFLISLSIPLSLFLLMIIVPFLIVDQFETTFIALANIKNIIRPEHIYHLWVQFIVNDGFFILIIFMAVLATQLQKKIFNSPAAI